jgi:hypothetical protein
MGRVAETKILLQQMGALEKEQFLFLTVLTGRKLANSYHQRITSGFNSLHGDTFFLAKQKIHTIIIYNIVQIF